MPEQVAEQFETFGGRTVVITGGASGIGLATARMVIDRGGSVILIGRSFDSLNAARHELGPAASIVPLDVTDENAVRAAFADIHRIDHLVTGPPEPFAVVSSISIPAVPANYSKSSSGGTTIA
jgi:NAD(P)-dependent dehydrogenase (short-subunit alcohol dehydrogenase family)